MRAKARAIVVISVTAGLLCLAGAAAPLAAQGLGSLADVAKQEQERRKNIKAPSKVLTNKDLTPAPVVAPAPAPAADASAPAATDPDKPAPAPAEGEKKAEEPAKDQAYWSKRFTELQSTVSRNEIVRRRAAVPHQCSRQ